MKVKITNFWAHNSIDLIIKDESLVLLAGKNGIGKSSIFNAIEYGLFGKMKDVSKEEGKRALVEISYKGLNITRSSNPHKLSLTYKDKIYDGESGQSIINKVVGCDYNKFAVGSYFTQINDRKNDNILLRTPMERLEFLKTLCIAVGDMDLIDSKREDIKADIRRLYDEKIAHYSVFAKIEHYYNSKKLEYEEERTRLKDKIKLLDSYIKDGKVVDYEKISNKKVGLNKEMMRLKKEIDSLNQEIEELQSSNTVKLIDETTSYMSALKHRYNKDKNSLNVIIDKYSENDVCADMFQKDTLDEDEKILTNVKDNINTRITKDTASAKKGSDVSQRYKDLLKQILSNKDMKSKITSDIDEKEEELKMFIEKNDKVDKHDDDDKEFETPVELMEYLDENYKDIFLYSVITKDNDNAKVKMTKGKTTKIVQTAKSKGKVTPKNTSSSRKDVGSEDYSVGMFERNKRYIDDVIYQLYNVYNMFIDSCCYCENNLISINNKLYKNEDRDYLDLINYIDVKKFNSREDVASTMKDLRILSKRIGVLMRYFSNMLNKVTMKNYDVDIQRLTEEIKNLKDKLSKYTFMSDNLLKTYVDMSGDKTIKTIDDNMVKNIRSVIDRNTKMGEKFLVNIDKMRVEATTITNNIKVIKDILASEKKLASLQNTTNDVDRLKGLKKSVSKKNGEMMEHSKNIIDLDDKIQYYSYKKLYDDMLKEEKEYKDNLDTKQLLELLYTNTLIVKECLKSAEILAVKRKIATINVLANEHIKNMTTEHISVNLVISNEDTAISKSKTKTITKTSKTSKTTKTIRGVKDDKKYGIYMSVYKNGIPLKYQRLSGGEKQLAQIAFTLAIHDSTGSNILLLDECLNNLDKDIGLQTIRYLDTIKNKLICVISHEAVEGTFKNVIRMSNDGVEYEYT
jgi:DNA repair exonuclease SbcCD ATPase subunit